MDPENFVNVYIQFSWKQLDLNSAGTFGMVQSKYHVYILLNIFFLVEQEGPPLQMTIYIHTRMSYQAE